MKLESNRDIGSSERALPKLVHLSRSEWLSEATQFQDYSIRQAWDYGTLLAERRKSRSEHVAISDGQGIIGLADIRLKEVPLLGGGLAFSSFGPLFRQRSDHDFDNLREILNVLTEEYVNHRKLVLRIQPPVSEIDDPERISQVFDEEGFVLSDSGRPYRTFFLSLKPPLDEIRANLKRRWRRHLNQSDRVDLEIVITRDPNSLEDLIDFHNRFVDKKGFHTDLDAKFFSEIQSKLPENESLVSMTAHKEGELVAGIVTSILGNTMIYLLGGRNEEGSRCLASYALHWKAIEFAKEKGIQWYDLGGIDPDENEGVFVFKQGFGGTEITTPGPFEIDSGSYKSKFFRLLEAAYRLRG